MEGFSIAGSPLMIRLGCDAFALFSSADLDSKPWPQWLLGSGAGARMALGAELLAR